MIERELQPAHTAGPWHRNIPPATKYTVIFAGRNTHICHVIPDGLTPEEVEANCDLIVAAPAMAVELTRLRKVNGELVGLVQEFLAYVERGIFNSSTVNWAREALKNSKEAI